MRVHENQSLAHNSNPTSTHEMIFTQETVGGIGSVGVVEDLELVVRRDDLGTTLSKSRSGALDDGLHVCSCTPSASWQTRDECIVDGSQGSRVVKTNTLMLLLIFSTSEPCVDASSLRRKIRRLKAKQRTDSQARESSLKCSRSSWRRYP
jgi:hypothetical protein